MAASLLKAVEAVEHEEQLDQKIDAVVRRNEELQRELDAERARHAS